MTDETVTDGAAGVFVPDALVDRIYAAAHVLPADGGGVVHATWYRKAFIGGALQRCHALRIGGQSRDEALTAWDGLISDDDDERTAAEMARMRDMILAEVYGDG